ncbi:MAG: primary-amine oxidase [Actinomycetales bacterium]
MPAGHPLDPLTAEEYRSAAEILAREKGITDGWRYASVALEEPPKAEVRAWAEGDPIQRRALAIVWEKATNDVYEAVVDLTADAVESWTHVPGVTPNFTVDEYHEVDHALHEHPQVREALAARGITDLSLVLFDVWTYGKQLMPEQWRDRRLGWCDIWMRQTPGGNPYAHPVAGLKVIVDMNTCEVLQIEDDHDYGLPEVHGEYDPAVTGLEPRTDVKPLEITQPEGVSFTLDGNELRWQNWSMRLGFNFREGPVIYQVAFDDHGERREIAYRMSFAEMVVPYRDHSFDHYRRTAFDIGEWGLGYMTTSLELGCDCLGEIVYADAVVPDSAGQPQTISQAMCLHEEDNAVLWKHVDDRAGAAVRRARRLVVSAHVTVANYEYLVYWRFYEDGNIECEVRATGIMVTTPYTGDTPPPYGTKVDEQTYAPIHQHFITARLDMEIDGPDNTVVMSETAQLPIGPDNPYGLALTQVSVPLRTEEEGKQDFDWNTQRAWKVTNPGKLNKLGTPVGYKLVPGAAFPAMLDPSSPVLERARVLEHTLWVTPFDAEERWPCGEFVNQSEHDEGLPVWTAANRSIDNTDVVLWYTFGIHHIPRVEDWPIMPVDTISFWLKPVGFFDHNPALDVAPSPARSDDACH